MKQQEKWNVLICTYKRLHKQVANYEKDTRKDITLHVYLTYYITPYTYHMPCSRLSMLCKINIQQRYSYTDCNRVHISRMLTLSRTVAEPSKLQLFFSNFNVNETNEVWLDQHNIVDRVR